MLTLIITFAILVFIYIIHALRRPENYPPGPSWLPIVGNVPLIKKLAKKYGGQHLALYNLAKEYKTNVLGLKFGSNYLVTVFKYPLLKTVLTSEEYEARPDNFFIKLRCMGDIRGVTCTEGDTWMVQRNFVVKHLRELGFGKAKMECMIKDELSVIVDELKKNSNKERRIGKFIAPSVLNVLWALITGRTLSRDDPQLDKLLDLFNRRSKAFDMSGGILSHFPLIRYLAPEKSGYNLLNNINLEVKKLFMSVIEEHLSNWLPDRDDDLIYAFISEMKKEKHHSSFNYDQLIMVCLDLFLAGAETTGNTIDFAILTMLLNQDIQEKARHHIHLNLDKTTELCYMDRFKLPYIEAILMEVQRYCNVAPIIGPRRAVKDTVLDKYCIPKGTTVLINLESVFMDRKIWGDPEIFRPERFLNEEGKVSYNEKFLPFGLGKRRCLGEVLARACIFIFFTGILRNFHITLSNGSEKPTLVPLPGITLSPREYKATLKQYD